MLASIGKFIQRIGGVGGVIFLGIGVVKIIFGKQIVGLKDVVIGLLLIVVTSYVAKSLGHKE
jgi:hypothetical protein